MKRTYRKEVYEAHEMMCRSQVRRNIINQHCRKFVAISRIVCVITAIAIIISSLIVYAAPFNDYDELIEQAKTPAIDVAAIETLNVTEAKTEPESFAALFSRAYYIEEGEITQEEAFPVIDLNKPNEEKVEEQPNNSYTSTEVASTDEHNRIEDEAFPVIDLNKSNEEKVEEQPNNGNHYISTKVTSTNEYPPIKEGFPAPPDDSYYTYTQEDYEYLLMIIVGEAQNCSKLHQMYVGSVVLNRLHDDKYFSYGDCIKSIALAPKQYACFPAGVAYKTPTALNIEVANELIANGSILPANVIFQAEFTQGDGVYAQIGNTYFCYKD